MANSNLDEQLLLKAAKYYQQKEDRKAIDLLHKEATLNYVEIPAKVLKTLFDNNPAIELCLELGKLLVDCFDYSAAIIIFQYICEKDPDLPQGYDGLIKTYSYKQDWDLALSIINLAKKKFPQQVSYLVKQSNILIKIGKYEEALIVINQGKSLFPHKIIFNLIEANLLKHKKENHLCIRLLQKLEAERPNSIPIKRAIINSYLECGDWKKAKELLSELISTKPEKKIQELLDSNPIFLQLRTIKPENKYIKVSQNLIQVFDDDIFIVSYPKSGNTWLRMLIAHLLYGDRFTISFDNFEDFVPTIYNYDANEFANIQRPRIIKSHQCFERNYSRVIYLVRDPRDIAISYYFYLIKIRKFKENYPLEKFISSFIRGYYHINFGTWMSNVDSWLDAKLNSGNFLLLKYEDLLNKGIVCLKKVSSFLDLDINDNRLLEIYQHCSASNMRQDELKSDWSPEIGKNIRQDIPFVRQASTGYWQKELPKPLATEIQKAWGKTMNRLGYD